MTGAKQRDVRMRGFSRRATVDAALEWVDTNVPDIGSEAVSLESAVGRVLAVDMVSFVDVPGFDRAMMDGYAVQAEDTLGATPYNRLPLTVVGEVFPGDENNVVVGQAQAVRIMTGAPLPAGANAVLPVEHTESDGPRIVASGEVSPGKHVGRRGEDIAANTLVLASGRRLRPQDVGLLSSIGIAKVPVRRLVKVRIVVTGNELLPPGTTPEGCRIADANSPMLNGLVQRDGGIVESAEIVADRPEAIFAAMRDTVDVVLISGGSSVGQEDHAPRLIEQHGELAIHGIAMRPSSPTGMGKLDGRLVFLLPGNPVSCLCAYDFFAGRSIRAAAGLSRDWPYRRVKLPLCRKLVSVVGRVDYARVVATDDGVEPLAIAGASILSSTTRADGFVIVASDSEGFPAGTNVEVFLYD